MASSELIAIIVKCGSCEKTVAAEGATFEVESEDLCDACSGGDSYTCFCNGGIGTKSLEFRCPCGSHGTIYVT